MVSRKGAKTKGLEALAKC